MLLYELQDLVENKFGGTRELILDAIIRYVKVAMVRMEVMISQQLITKKRN